MAVDQIFVLGASLGGIQTLQMVLGQIPPSFDAAIAVVQHRGEDSTDSLATLLAHGLQIPVTEAEDKTPLTPGRVLLAPAGYHLLIGSGCCELSLEGPVLGARPSIDVLFESAARSYGSRVTAVALTCASKDGARGAACVEAAGGRILVQQLDSAKSQILPQATLESCPTAQELPLQGIIDEIQGCNQS